MAWQDDPVVTPDIAWQTDQVVSDVPSLETQTITPQGDFEEEDYLYHKTGLTRSQREKLNTPFREAMQVPAVSPETMQKVIHAGLHTGLAAPDDLRPGDTEAGPTEQGITETLASAGSGMTSGAGVASLPEYMFPPTAAFHAAESAQEVPKQIQEVIDTAQGGNPKETAAATTQALLNILMTAGIIHGGSRAMGPRPGPWISERPPMEDLIRQQQASRLPPPIPPEYAQRQFTAPGLESGWQMGPGGEQVPVGQPEPPTRTTAAPPLLETLKGISPTPGVREVPQSRALAVKDPNFMMRPEAQPDIAPAPSIEETLEKAQPPPVDPAEATHERTRAVLENRQRILNEIEQLRPLVMNARKLIPGGERALEKRWTELNGELNNRATNPIVHAPPPRTGVTAETARLPGAGVQVGPPIEEAPAVAPSSEVRTNIPSETARIGQPVPQEGPVQAPSSKAPKGAGVAIPPEDARYAGLNPGQHPTASESQKAPVGAANKVAGAREQAGLTEAPPSGIGVSWHDSVAEGNALIDKGADAYRIVSEFKTNKLINRQRMGVARAWLERLQRTNQEAHGELELDPANPDKIGKAQAAETDETEFWKGYQPMKTEWSNIGTGMQEMRGITDADLLSQKTTEQVMREHMDRELNDSDKARAATAVKNTRQANTVSEEGFTRALEHAEKEAKAPPMTPEQMREHFAKRIKELTPC